MVYSAQVLGFAYDALDSFGLAINDSKGMPSSSCRFRIISIESPGGLVKHQLLPDYVSSSQAQRIKFSVSLIE